MKRPAAVLGIALLALLAALAAKGMLLQLPAVRDAPAAGQFDTNRAYARLGRILGDERPHPVDSDANDALRARLVAELRAIGLVPRVTNQFSCNSFAAARGVACGRVRNVVATLGPAHGKHLLLSAHYDSTFAGPGAADAGVGVATLLETAAQLRGERLARPVSFLFNEGEEMGLLGARAFLTGDPLAPRVDTLINLEARGVTGPAIMFETSRPNGAAISAYRAVERPLANSLTTDFYGLIPNSTDVATFSERDWTVLNFALIGNEPRYHTAGDNLAALDRRSLQHMGDQTLALARRLTGPPAAQSSGERIYTDLLGRTLVVLPLALGVAGLGALLLLFLAVATRRKALGRPLLACVAALLGSAALAWAGDVLVSIFRSGEYWRGYPAITQIAVYASAVAACVGALVLIARMTQPQKLRAAFWLLFVSIGAGLSLVAPGASVFFLLAPVLAAAGIGLSRWWPGAERAGGIAAAVALYLQLGPTLALIHELLNSMAPWIFAPLASLLLLPAVIELRELLISTSRRLALGVVAGIVLAAWSAAALVPAYSQDRQQVFGIEYVWEAHKRRGTWAVAKDGAPLPPAFAAVGPWRQGKLDYSPRRRWLAPAPRLPLSAPTVTKIGEVRTGKLRRLRVRLGTNGAAMVTLIAPANAQLRAAGSGGAQLRKFGKAGGDNRYYIRCTGRSCAGALFELVTASPRPILFTVVGMHPGLPPAGRKLSAARPQLSRPQHYPDATMAVGQVRL